MWLCTCACCVNSVVDFVVDGVCGCLFGYSVVVCDCHWVCCFDLISAVSCVEADCVTVYSVCRIDCLICRDRLTVLIVV